MRLNFDTSAKDTIHLQQRLHALPIRTYRQIAEILAERDGVCLSTTHIRRACLSAEQQLVDAILNDSELRLEAESD